MCISSTFSSPIVPYANKHCSVCPPNQTNSSLNNRGNSTYSSIMPHSQIHK